MIYLVVGGALVVGLLLLVRWFTAADVKQLADALRWVAVACVGLIAAYLIFTERWALLVPVLGSVGLWALRMRSAAALWRRFRGAPRPGQSSTIETRFFRMTLDHEAGSLTGEVKEGPMAGRRVEDLDLESLLVLRDQCRREDPQSLQILEAYLDRAHEGWRARDSAAGEAAPPRSGMTREEAYRILGVEPGASEDQIRDAHRRLMAKLHPDRGGSDYLAAQINRAKDLLLGT